MKAKHILPILVLLIMAVLFSQPTSADEPHRMFLPAIPVNNGGCSAFISDPPFPTVVWVQDPSSTIDVLSPCDPVYHMRMRTFYQDAEHPEGYWTTWARLPSTRFQMYKEVLGRTQIWVEFTSLGAKPYSVETSTP